MYCRYRLHCRQVDLVFDLTWTARSLSPLCPDRRGLQPCDDGSRDHMLFNQHLCWLSISDKQTPTHNLCTMYWIHFEPEASKYVVRRPWRILTLRMRRQIYPKRLPSRVPKLSSVAS